jgi:hypothetical protein
MHAASSAVTGSVLQLKLCAQHRDGHLMMLVLLAANCILSISCCCLLLSDAAVLWGNQSGKRSAVSDCQHAAAAQAMLAVSPVTDQ